MGVGVSECGKRALVMVLVVASVAAGAMMALSACARSATPATTTSSPAVTPGSVAPSTTSEASSGAATTGSLPTVQRQDIAEAFAQLAQVAQSVPVFAPTDLPSGTVLAPNWLPVLESAHPEAGTSSGRQNPYIAGEGGDVEVQVVLQVDQGWLVILENFHGDLGDVAGQEVGSVDGNPARLYEVNGGVLVQWSANGLWYGVFGRGLSQRAIVAVALNMVQASAESL